MRKIHKLLPAVALALGAAEAGAQVLYEPFNYAVGTSPLEANAADPNKNYTTSGTYWSQRGTNTPPFTVGPGLSAPNFQGVATPPVMPDPMGGSGQFSSSNSSRTPTIGFGQVFSSGDVYYSLSFKIPDGGLATSGAGNLAGFSNFAIPANGPAGVFQAGLRLIPSNTTTYQLGMTGGGTTQTFTGKTFGTGDTVFVVARYRIVPGGNNDQVAMWFNPTANFGGDEASIPTPDLAWTYTSGDATHDQQPASTPTIAGWFMRSYAATSNLRIDELRVDTKWAGVTPDGNLQYTWTDAGGGANTFANPDKWTKLAGAPAAAPNGVGHVANFGAGIAGGSTVTSAGETFDTINFNNAGGVTIDGAGLTVGTNTSAGQVYAYAGNHTINAPITMGSNLSIKTAPGTSVTLGAAISGAKTLGVYGTGTVHLGAGGSIDDAARLEVRSGTLDLGGKSETVDAFQLGASGPNPGTALPAPYNGDLATGTLSNGSITANSYDLQSGAISAAMGGAGGVEKNNAGFVTLSGNNTYTGNTVVNSGQLTLAGTNSNPVTAIINLTPQISGAINNLAITSDAALGDPLLPGASVTWTADANVSSGTLLFAENMTLGANRLLNANHNASRIGAATGKTATIAGDITGAGGINVVGPGVVILGGATAKTYAGNTVVSGGRLQLPNTTVAPGFGVAGKYIANSGGTLGVNLGGAGEWTNADLDTLLGTATFNAGSLLGFDTTNAAGPQAYASNIAVPGVVKLGTGSLTLSGALSATGAGVRVQDGTLVLTGNNTYTGITNIDAGVLRISSSTALGSSAVDADRTFVSGGSAGATASLELDGAAAGGLTIAEPIRIEGKSGGVSGNATPHIRNVSGNNTISAPLRMDAAGTWYNLQSDAGTLTVAGVNNQTGNATGRVLNLRGAGDGEITAAIQNVGANTTGTVTVNKFDAGTWTLSAANAYTGTTTINAGTLRTTGAGTLGAAGGNVVNDGTLQSYSSNTLGNVSGVGSTVVGDGTTAVNVTANHVRQGALSVADGSVLKVNADPTAAGVSNVGTLTIATDGKLDLNSNKLVTNTPVGTFSGGAYDGVHGQVQRAYHSGAWDRPGLMTSQPNAGPTIGTTTIGVASASTILFIAPTATGTWAGQEVTGTTALAMYTYAGDLNFDGRVDAQDYGIIDNWVQFPGTNGYANGDINYDGVIDAADYGIIDNTIQLQGAPIPVTGAVADAAGAGLSGVTAVPEPTSLGVLGLAAAGLFGRRRRRRAAK